MRVSLFITDNQKFDVYVTLQQYVRKILQFKEREEKLNCQVLYHTFDRNVAGIVVSFVDQDNIFIYWTAKTIARVTIYSLTLKT